MKSYLKVVTLLCCLITHQICAAPLKVTFINPGHPVGDDTGAFWSNVSRFMQAAADDLEIELTTLYAKRNHLLMVDLSKEVARLSPDYVIIVNEKGAGTKMLKTLAKYSVPVFSLLNGFNNKELKSLNKTQRKLLIGALLPDNFTAGNRLMAELLNLHQQKAPTLKQFNLVALRGDFRTAAALNRYQGLESFLDERPEIQFIDNPVVSWSKDIAYQKIKGLIQRQRIDIIWAANDAIAKGAKRAVIEAQLPYKVTIGGFNWDKPLPDLPLDISYGGHVLLGAKALLMLNDYHSGIIRDCAMQRKLDIFTAGTMTDISQFHHNTQGEKLADFDFTRFSQSHPTPAALNMQTFVTHTYQPQLTPHNCKSQ